MTDNTDSSNGVALADLDVEIGSQLVYQFVPEEIRDMLGDSPAMNPREEHRFEVILDNIAEAINPDDFVEWIWVKDIADLTWEVDRARRAQKARILADKRRAIEDILRANHPSGIMDALVEDPIPGQVRLILRSDQQQTRAFTALLVQLGLSPNHANDAAYNVSLDEMERYQRIIDNSTYRRDAVLREIDRRRDAKARRLRSTIRAIDEATDAEFNDVA